MSEKPQLSARVDEDTYKRFRIAAAEENTDMAKLLREVVDGYLEELEADEGNRTARMMAAD